MFSLRFMKELTMKLVMFACGINVIVFFRQNFNWKYERNNLFSLQKVVISSLLLYLNLILLRHLFNATSDSIYFSLV